MQSRRDPPADAGRIARGRARRTAPTGATAERGDAVAGAALADDVQRDAERDGQRSRSSIGGQMKDTR